MKSLEIVNEKINHIDKKGDYTTWCGMGEAILSKSQLEQIKADLEDYFIIREIEEKVREGKMVVRNGKKYYASEFILAEQGTIRHLTIWYDDYKKVISFDDYKKTWYFED